MKTIKFYAIITALVFLTASCVENSGKYKAAIAQRDSLELVKQALDSNYSQTLVVLNDIETGFSEINQKEREMKVNLKGVEGKKTTTTRQVIAAQMMEIKSGIEQNKAKIAELRRLAAKNGKTNNKLTETIKRLQSEMDDKTVQIQSLQAELEQKNIKINELNTTVDNQSKNISEQQNVMDQQKTTIKGQDKDINTVWYCIASSKKLKEAKIVSTSGLFQPKKVMDSEFDNRAFTQVDLRSLTSIATDSKNIKIITSHPQSSYVLETGDDKKITIKIINSSKFWSVSKYLVVQI
jgi:predicted RNase H-like nuclease (RuvC/YqgF family)